MEFPFADYGERTGAASDGRLNVDRLEELQRAQMLSIPFENFDIQLGRGINLDAGHLFSKLIRSRRGGYCFELNGLLLAALKHLGFDARALLARVHVSGQPGGRSHQISLVTIADRNWVVDVGFGAACPRVPIPLETETETLHGSRVMRLTEHALGYMLQQKVDDTWSDLYSFDLTPVVRNDIIYGNHFTSTHPESFFTAARIAVRWHADGHTALFNYRCTTARGSAEERVEDFPDDDRYLLLLSDRFDIELDAGYEELAPLNRE